jgi:3',5'-cyclic AMP phosphodiesterase CpdA
MRLAWLTDIHLNFLRPAQLEAFCDGLLSAGPEALLITGDISEAPQLEGHLRLLEERLARPIYFVLGNHDYYRGSIAEVRERVRALCAGSRHLRWLPQAGVVELAPGCALVGHDGWADGRAGDWAGSEVELNDYYRIRELTFPDKPERLAAMTGLAAEAAAHLRLALAGTRAERVLVATHVPPFAEACWHQGKMSDAQWLPHFTSVAVGEALRQAAQAQPGRKLEVYCGHTHSSGVVRVLPNLEVWTGAAEYGRPELAGLIQVGPAQAA